MKVIILTTSIHGTTGHHLPILYGSKDIEIAMVVVSEGSAPKKKNHYLRRIKKILAIGPLGALNGIKMRKWYNEDVKKYCDTGDAREFCSKHGIPFTSVPYTNSVETQKIFKDTGADVGLSLGNGYISKKVFSIPRYGMLNIHHELLPLYQNAQSIIWQLYNGSAETGYTVHKIDSKIDGGDIVWQEKIPIVMRDTLDDTVAYNYARLYDASVQGLLRIFADFKKYYSEAKPQGAGGHYTTPSYGQFLKIKRQFERLKKSMN